MKNSFIMLTYNQQKFVAEAVWAALAQEGPALEIILSDDCSTDHTFEIIQETVAGYTGPHRVVLNRNLVNIGVVANIRKAYEMSHGEILIAASGDDISLPDRSWRTVSEFEKKAVWLIHSHAHCIDMDGKDAASTYLSARLVATAGTTPDLKRVAVARGLYLGATAAFHRNLFRKYGYLSNPLAYEDLVYGFRAALEGRIGFIDRPLIKYRVGSGVSTSHIGGVPEARRKAEISTLRSFAAVLAQRRRDSDRFGLPVSDPIRRAIQKRRKFTILQLYYWGEAPGKRLRKLIWWHPIIAFAAFIKVLKHAARLVK